MAKRKHRKNWRQPLTVAFVKSAKPGRYGDGGRGGHGLYLRVWKRPNGRTAKTWGQELRIQGFRRNLGGIGSAYIVTLKEAREVAAKRYAVAQRGGDPRKSYRIPTFDAYAPRVIAFHKESWKAGSRLPDKWANSFRDHVSPTIGSKRLDTITTDDVLGIIRPLWATKRPTAKAVLQRIGSVMKLGIVKGYRTDNPADPFIIVSALPKAGGKTKHHDAIPHADVRAALAKVEACSSFPATKLAIRFLALTALRSIEVRGARWNELDMDAAIWTVPMVRIKHAEQDHIVPLSDAALDVLRDARKLSNGQGYVFPSKPGGLQGDNTYRTVFKRLKLAGTPHGLRSSFVDWATERGDVPEVVYFACIAQKLGASHRRAYRRTTLLAMRTVLMQEWADYIA